jgi:hypothetical protein
MANAGAAAATPKTAEAAAEMKALRDCSGDASAFMTTALLPVETAAGAKAEETANVERTTTAESFIFRRNSEEL